MAGRSGGTPAILSRVLIAAGGHWGVWPPAATPGRCDGPPSGGGVCCQDTRTGCATACTAVPTRPHDQQGSSIDPRQVTSQSGHETVVRGRRAPPGGESEDCRGNDLVAEARGLEGRRRAIGRHPTIGPYRHWWMV